MVFSSSTTKKIEKEKAEREKENFLFKGHQL